MAVIDRKQRERTQRALNMNPSFFCDSMGDFPLFTKSGFQKGPPDRDIDNDDDGQCREKKGQCKVGKEPRSNSLAF